MLMDCVTRRSIRRRFGNGLNLVPLEAGENERSASLYKSQSLSAEEQAKVRRLMSACDEDTRAHSWRVANLAKEMACYLHLSSAEVCISLLSALLHDIGKVRMPRELLGKQGPLNAREWEVVRRHPEVGAQMLEGEGGIFVDLAANVMAHHERWDGDGYPRGLRGEQIPLVGRLLAVIDSFDAMTSQRPYQPALTDVEACMELQRCAGTQYDPLFVDAFLCMLSMKNPSIPSWSFPSIQLPAANKSAIA